MLVTRPEPGATELAERLAALGWRPVLAPALVLAPCSGAGVPTRAQAVLLTSRAAARAMTAPQRPVPVFAVGEATAAEARARGFADVSAAPGGDAAALATHVMERCDPRAGPLCLAVGDGYGRDLESTLRAGGFRVLRRVAYVAQPARSLPEAARVALTGRVVVAALLLSPRSAAHAVSLIRAAGLSPIVESIEALCISERVARAAAEAAAPYPWRAIRVAARPDQGALLHLLGPRPRPSPTSTGQSGAKLGHGADALAAKGGLPPV